METVNIKIIHGMLKPSGMRKERVPLDNNKTISENGVGNNDTIQTLIATPAD